MEVTSTQRKYFFNNLLYLFIYLLKEDNKFVVFDSQHLSRWEEIRCKVNQMWVKYSFHPNGPKIISLVVQNALKFPFQDSANQKYSQASPQMPPVERES